MVAVDKKVLSGKPQLVFLLNFKVSSVRATEVVDSENQSMNGDD